MGKRIIKNYPAPRLMETIGATNQSVPEAIGELVANCFDARVENEKMHIVVTIRDGKISVIDNGKGMNEAVLEKAVCIAEDMSRYIERGEGAKGHFGMGFKTSCSTLGGYYEIFTRPINEDEEYHVAFDISDYSRRPSGANAWDVVVEDKPKDANGPLGSADHGTAFVVSRLKDRHITVSAVLNYLGTAFKGHIKAGDQIVVVDSNGSYPAVANEGSHIKGTRIDIDTVCGPNGAYRITGWMALSDQTHNDGLYGFNIYRHNQLVEKWDKSWFRPHLMTSRIFGEVNLDFLDATFYKQGLQQTEVWKIVTEHMKEYLRPLSKASNAVSKRGNINKPAELKKIVSNLRDDYEEDPIDIDFEKGSSSKSDSKQSQAKSGVNDKIKNVAKEQSLSLADEGKIAITYAEKTNKGNVEAPFDYIFEPGDDSDEQSELQVLVFLDHPLWNKKVDKDVIKVLATSDAIYRMLVEKLGMETNEALRIRNEWVSIRTNPDKEA